jgi:hypothetical protein
MISIDSRERQSGGIERVNPPAKAGRTLLSARLVHGPPGLFILENQRAGVLFHARPKRRPPPT